MIKELAVCAEIEEAVSEIYSCLAEQLPAGDELRLIWEEMSRDELDHARLLHFAQKLDPGEVYAGYHLEEEEGRRLLVEVRHILEMVRMQTMSPDESVLAMLKLEEEFMNVHARYAIKCREASLQETFNHLGKADEAHVARLKEYAQRP